MRLSLSLSSPRGFACCCHSFFAVESCPENVFSRQQHDDDHAPDGEQSVAHRVGDGVAERRDLALGLVADQTKRCRRRPRPGNDSEVVRVVEAEHVLGGEHAENQGNRGGDRAPQEETNALRFQAVDEARAGGDSDDGDEDVEADRVHEPDGGCRNAAELRANRTQPAANDPGNRRAASSSSVLPSTSLVVTKMSTPSTGTASSSRSSTSTAAAPRMFTSTSRSPATATTSPSFRTMSAVASMISPPRRMRRMKRRASGTSDSASATRRPAALPAGCTL